MTVSARNSVAGVGMTSHRSWDYVPRIFIWERDTSSPRRVTVGCYAPSVWAGECSPIPSAVRTAARVTRRYRPRRRTGTGKCPSRARRYDSSRPTPKARPAVGTSMVAGHARISSGVGTRALMMCSRLPLFDDLFRGGRNAIPRRAASVPERSVGNGDCSSWKNDWEVLPEQLPASRLVAVLERRPMHRCTPVLAAELPLPLPGLSSPAAVPRDSNSAGYRSAASCPEGRSVR